MKPTQRERVLAHLKQYGTITPLESWQRIGVYRLAARIKELRDEGHTITSRPRKVRNRWGERCTVAEYCLQGEK